MVSALLMTLGLVGVAAGLIYTFLVWNFDHWKKRGVKGPKPKPFYGSLPNMVTQKRHVAYDLMDIYKQYHQDEDFVGIYSVRSPQLLVLSPELTHKMYTTDFKNFSSNEASTWFDEKSDFIMANNPFMLTGDEWKERRQEVTPGLTANRIKTVYPVTQQVCGNLVKYIKNERIRTSKTGMDAKEISLRFTADVVTDCVLGVKAQSFTENPLPVFGMIKNLFQTTTVFTVYVFLAGLWPTIKYFYKAKFLTKETENFFCDLMSSAFDMRRKKITESRVDFLNYILQLQEKKNMSDRDIMSHSMTFLLDGFETSSSVIAGCLYQLGRNPNKQAILYEEIMNNLNENGEIDFEKLDSLPYLDQCLNESMRIILPLLTSTKLCTAPCELTNKNGSKLRLRVNDVIVIPFHAFCHDEQYFPNPEEFIPERFNAENGGYKKYRDMGVFLPFGDGPRLCLGMRFALIQTKAALSTLVKNFNIKLNPQTRKDNLLHPTYFLGSLDGGIWIDFEERK